MTKDGEFGQEERNFLATSSDGTVLLGIPLVSAMDVGSPGAEGIIKMEDDEDLDGPDKNDVDEDVDVNQMLSVVNAGGNLIRTNHATLESLLSTPVSGSQVFAQSEGIQVITLPTATELIGLTGDLTERLLHVVPAGDLSSLATKCIGFIAIANPGLLSQGKADITGFSGLEMIQTSDVSDLSSATADNMAAILMPPPPPLPDLPSNCPPWAMRLKKCEKIGDSYRGYVETEIDLDLILTLHKQQTNSFWGTRQSPSPAKASTRLMWKSQYVPFDGIPFVNAGSRAVVMECQFGPRRKGTLGKRGATSNISNEFKQTCPARIYIKKVRKFPSYAVNLNMDKKSVRLAMDKAFHELREHGLDSWGEERFYVQLPTEKAHDYHEECSNSRMDTSSSGLEESALGGHEYQRLQPDDKTCESRIHPVVLEKIRRLVASGETKLYNIRRQLRRFVVRDLFQVTGHLPERHDLTMFPTVNDLKNHIHQALKDIESGLLPYTPQMVNLEVIQSCDGSNSEEKDSLQDEKPDITSMWSSGNISSGGPMPETVTVTLTQNPDEDGHHIISRIETHLSDGTTQISATLTPETAQLLSRLHPGLFPAGSILRLDETTDESPESKSINNHLGVLEMSEASPSEDHPLSSSQDSSMEAAVHVIGEMDSAHLTSMVVTDSSHSISGMIDSDVATSILVSSEPSHSMSTIHLHHNPNQHISGLIDSDSTNLATIIQRDAQHHIAGLIIPGTGLSIIGAVDPGALSDMVNVTHSDATTLSVDDGVHSMDLESGDGVGASLSLVGDVCEQLIPKSDLDDQDDSHEKLSEDKLILHITPDEQIGMTRLENKVSDL